MDKMREDGTKRYGVLLARHSKNGAFDCALFDTVVEHATEEAALEGAREFFWNKGHGLHDCDGSVTSVLALLEVNGATGATRIVMNRRQLESWFEACDREDKRQEDEDHRFGTYEEQHRSDYYAGLGIETGRSARGFGEAYAFGGALMFAPAQAPKGEKK